MASSSTVGRSLRVASSIRVASGRGIIRRSASSVRSSDTHDPSDTATLAIPLPEMLSSMASLREEGRRPTQSAYSDLLKSVATFHADRSIPPLHGSEPSMNPPQALLPWDIANSVLEDAARGRIDLADEDYEHILAFSGSHPATLPQILRQIPRKARVSSGVMTRLCRSAVYANNLEQLLAVLHEMYNRGIEVSLPVVAQTVRLCTDIGLSRLALEITLQYEAESKFGARAPPLVWSRILRSSASTSFYEGVETAWSRTIGEHRLDPDEGLLIDVLNTAARCGKPEMVSRVLDALSIRDVEPQEHHLNALLEAYVNAGQVPQALQVLSTIRSVGLTPTSLTAAPILTVLNSVDVVDKAFYALEDIKAKGEAIDITALNVIIEACRRLKDLQRVMANQAAAPDLGVRLNVDSYNSALAACADAGHRELGDKVMKDMTETGVSPNGTTFHHMILLCLSQAKYDDAFYFLERSKSEGFKPLAEVYQRLADKCEGNRDARWRLVVEEMENLGYRRRRVSSGLRDRDPGGSRSRRGPGRT